MECPVNGPFCVPFLCALLTTFPPNICIYIFFKSHFNNKKGAAGDHKRLAGSNHHWGDDQQRCHSDLLCGAVQGLRATHEGGGGGVRVIGGIFLFIVDICGISINHYYYYH